MSSLFKISDRFFTSSLNQGPAKLTTSGQSSSFRNLRTHATSVTRVHRESQNEQIGRVIWFTGLSGSGKSTIANALEVELHAMGRRTYLLDGDNVRQGLTKDLGFSAADRAENIRRIAEVAKLMLDAGLIVLTAFISPFRIEREMARALIGPSNFYEVFVSTTLDVCEQRDTKGLYMKARSGQLQNMTGIDSPYEEPLNPDLNLDCGDRSVEHVLLDLLTGLNAKCVHEKQPLSLCNKVV